MGQWVNTPKGPRYQHDDGSYTYADPGGNVRDGGSASTGDFWGTLAAPFGFAPRSRSRQIMQGNQRDPQFVNSRQQNLDRLRTAPEFQVPSAAAAPAAPTLPPPPTTPAPAAAAPAQQAQTAAVLAKASSPIAPGASDLADATEQLARLGLGRRSSAFQPAAGSVASSYKIDPGVIAKGGAMPAAWDSKAFAASGDGLQAADAYKIDPGSIGGATAKVNFSVDPAVAFSGASSDEDLNARRRAAFLSGGDSLEGMKRVRQVLADEIGARGGDLQGYAKDSNQMRPMYVKDLEGYLGQLKGGAAPAAGATAAAPVDSGPIARPGFDPLQDEYEAGVQDEINAIDEDLAPYGGAVEPAAAGQRREVITESTPQITRFESRAVDGPTAEKLDRYLTDVLGPQLRANPASGNQAVQDYQKFQQGLPGLGGEPDANELSVRATTGVAKPPGEQAAMYGAHNALAMGLGTAKPGATVQLPQLSDEELARIQAMRGTPAMVQPPMEFRGWNPWGVG